MSDTDSQISDPDLLGGDHESTDDDEHSGSGSFDNPFEYEEEEDDRRGTEHLEDSEAEGSYGLQFSDIAEETPQKTKSKTSVYDDEEAEEKDDWDIFLDEEKNFQEDEQLVEANPLYEMANVNIDVEDALAEMEETLRRALEQMRVTDRERTVLLDKFSLFLQALVSFQESEVELIDNIRMKTDIMQVLQSFMVDDTKDTQIMISEEKSRKDTGGAEGGEEEQEWGHDAGAMTIDEMDAKTLRENLLIQKNKLEMQEQLKMIHLLEIKQMEFEKTLLTMHYAKMIKPSDIKKELRDLRKAINDMKIEISSMQQESAQLQLDISFEEKFVREEEAEVNQLDLDTLSKQIEVAHTAGKPIHLSKEADREAQKLEHVQDTLQELEEKYMLALEKYRVYKGKIDQKNSEFAALLTEEQRLRQADKLTQQETDRVLLDTEALQKKEHGLLDRSRMAIERIAYNVKLKKKLYEEHHSIHNDTTRAQREYVRLERLVKTTIDSHLNAKMAYEKMRSAFEITQPKGSSTNWDKLRRMFLREIENLKIALSNKLEEAEYSANAVANLQKQLHILYEEQVNCGKELQDQLRLTVRKRHERQSKAEQCIKLEAQLFALVIGIRLKKGSIDDAIRNERDLRRAIVIVRKKFAHVKIEKSALATELIRAKQRVTEQVEKFKIANNEIESYVNQELDRARQIKKIHYLLLNAGLGRDSMRNSALRAVQKLRFHRIERDELRMANNNTRKQIERLRGDITKIRNRFEQAIESSGKIACTVRVKTEEVCMFMERMHALDIILLKGTSELHLREIEKSKLESILTGAKTHSHIVTQNQPDESPYVAKVEELRAQVYAMTKERRSLEDQLSNITEPGRVREINHNWMEEREQPNLLRKKIRKLEGLLATREVRILERDLELKQIDEITESSMEMANWLKHKYANDVRTFCYNRIRLAQLSKKVDGMISETQLAKARAEDAEKKYNRLKCELEKAERRFAQGKPPTRQFEAEWNHKVWQDTMLKRSKKQYENGGFPVDKPHPGSDIMKERYRKKCQPYSYKSVPAAIELPPQQGPKFPYKPKSLHQRFRPKKQQMMIEPEFDEC